jgi:hypothetical protein
MNRRHENMSCQANKKNTKAVKDGLEHETPLKKSKSCKKSEPPCESKHKKTSKRSSPKDKIEDSTPSHPQKEGNRWGDMLKKQTEENNRRIKQQENKRPSK